MNADPSLLARLDQVTATCRHLVAELEADLERPNNASGAIGGPTSPRREVRSNCPLCKFLDYSAECYDRLREHLQLRLKPACLGVVCHVNLSRPSGGNEVIASEKGAKYGG